MNLTQLNTITDVQTLRAMVVDKLQTIAERDQVIARHERTLTERDARIGVLTAEIARLRRVQFAAKSEKMDPEQRTLFDETMAADIAAVEAELETLQAQMPSATPDRKRPAPPRCLDGTEDLDAGLPAMRHKAVNVAIQGGRQTSEHVG